MTSKAWTLVVPLLHSDHLLMAQHKSSHAEAWKRAKADDPIWNSGRVRVVRMRKWANKHFRRGLAFRCLSEVDKSRGARG